MTHHVSLPRDFAATQHGQRTALPHLLNQLLDYLIGPVVGSRCRIADSAIFAR
jgi:hypothetical protein